jgi:hypothetical protein
LIISTIQALIENTKCFIVTFHGDRMGIIGWKNHRSPTYLQYNGFDVKNFVLPLPSNQLIFS